MNLSSNFSYNSSVENLPGFTSSIIFTNTVQSLFDATIGEVYYYEITETAAAPHYKKLFDSILVKVYAQRNASTGANEVIASIEKIKLPEQSTWEDYSASSYAGKLEISVDGSKVLIKWANSLSYDFRIQKKSYTGTIPENGVEAIERKYKFNSNA